MKLLFFSHNIDFALGWMVVHAIWQATIIALVTGLILISLRKKSAQTHYAVANAALFSVLGMAIITFFYYYSLANTPGQLSFIPDSGQSSMVSGQMLNNNRIPDVASTDSFNNTSDNQLTSAEFKSYFNRNLPLIVSFWVLGVTFFLLRLLSGISYIQYLRRRMNFPPDEYWTGLKDKILENAGVHRTVDLVESALVRTPMVIGHLKPMILFPMSVLNRLSPEEVEAILSHEIAHILRNDYLVNIAQSIVEALFYFHPAIWWLSAQVRNARESCCDDKAIQLCGSSVNYAKALVAVQDMNYYPLTPSLAFAGQQKNQLVMRIERILHPSSPTTSNIMEKTIACAVLLAVIASLSFTSRKVGNEQSTMVGNGISDISIIADRLTDSLPANTSNGVYNFSDNTQDIQLKVQDNKPVALTINGVEIPEKDLPKFDALANKIVNRNIEKNTSGGFNVPEPPSPPNAPIPPDFNFSTPIPPSPPMPPSPPIASIDGKIDINITDEDGSHFVLNNKDGVFSMSAGDAKDGSHFIMNNKDGVFSMSAGDAKDKTNFKMFGGKNGFSMFSNDGKSKISRNGKDMIIRGDDGAVTTIKNNKGSNTSTVITEKGNERTEIETGKKGQAKIKKFKNNQLIEELEVRGDKVFINGKEATDEELRQHGYFRNGNGSVSKIGGFNNIQSNFNFNTDFSPDIQSEVNENVAEAMRDMNGDWSETKSDLNESLKNLKIDLKNCAPCQANWKENFSREMENFKFQMQNQKFKNNEQLQAKIGALNGQLEGLQARLNAENEKSDNNNSDRQNNENWNIGTENVGKQFIADGLIKNPSKYKFTWSSKKGLFIDGKKVPLETEKKYLEMFNLKNEDFDVTVSKH